MSREFWWWTRGEISKNHRLSCSSSTSTRTACLFALKFCTEVQETLLHKSVSAFFVIVSGSLFAEEQVSSKTTHFYKKYMKLIISKPMKNEKNADSLLFLLLCYLLKKWKKILKNHSLRIQALEKGEKQLILGILYHNIYRIQKINSQ